MYFITKNIPFGRPLPSFYPRTVFKMKHPNALQQRSCKKIKIEGEDDKNPNNVKTGRGERSEPQLWANRIPQPLSLSLPAWAVVETAHNYNLTILPTTANVPHTHDEKDDQPPYRPMQTFARIHGEKDDEVRLLLRRLSRRTHDKLLSQVMLWESAVKFCP